MTVIQTQSVLSQPNATSTGAQPQAGSISSDFETFLKMLTTQMQNQDPLNPIDSADYAVQLATFSNVEQSVRTNQLLEAMQTQFNVMGLAQLAGWIGQEARSAAPAFMDGTPVTLQTEIAAQSDRAVLVVRDSAGTVVARDDIPSSATAHEWQGTDATGAPLPQGHYTLTLESYRGDELLTTRAVEHYAQIIEARSGNTGPVLVLRGGIEVPAQQITALRIP